MDTPGPTRAQRTPQACATCRRRKTKCDGVRPRCRHCSSRRIPCVWPPGPAVDPMPHALPDGPGSHVSPTESTQSDALAHLRLPDRRKLSRCFSIFFDLHFPGNLCSFVHKPDLENEAVEMPFLIIAIICLCSRYLTPDEADEAFGLPSGAKVARHYTSIARTVARATSDDPTVQNIQANLVLALSEFFGNAGSRPWMYAGTAIRMAQIMRLNKEYHQSHSLKEQEIRRRTLWACIMFDKLLAYFLAKPQTISMANVSIALPGTDASLAYQEATRGLTLENLPFFVEYPSEIGILPYFIKTLSLWSEIVDFNVCNRRFVDKLPPTDITSSFSQRHQNMEGWEASLPPSLQWTPQNYANHASLGQGRDFVAMHFLIRSAFCVAHQSYLPQLDGFSILLDAVDAAGLSLLHREPVLISTCVSNSLALGAATEEMFYSCEKARSHLRSTWVAAALLTASNTYMWIQYANDPEYSSAEVVDQARRLFDLVLTLVTEWAAEWKSARVWLQTLKAMQAMYRAAYLGEMDEPSLDQPSRPASPSEEEGRETAAPFRPKPGDGYPSLDNISHLLASLRFLTNDTSADPKLLHSVWKRFANGWPQDLVTGLTEDLRRT